MCVPTILICVMFNRHNFRGTNAELEAASYEDPANLCWFSGCVEDMNIFSASGSSTVVGQFKKHVHIF